MMYIAHMQHRDLVDGDYQGEPRLLALRLMHRDTRQLQLVRHRTARDRVREVDVTATQEVLVASQHPILPLDDILI